VPLGGLSTNGTVVIDYAFAGTNSVQIIDGTNLALGPVSFIDATNQLTFDASLLSTNALLLVNQGNSTDTNAVWSLSLASLTQGGTLFATFTENTNKVSEPGSLLKFATPPFSVPNYTGANPAFAGKIFFLPEQSLDDLKGESANGVWQLEIWDSRVGATNPPPELLGWNLAFVFEQPSSNGIVVDPFVTVSNTVPANGFLYLAVDVPLWASVASNYLLSADLPLSVWFNQTTPPTGVAPPDTLFLTAVTNGEFTLLTNSAPPLVPGQRYFVGLQNTNPVPVNFAYRVDFDITPLTNMVPYVAVTSSNGIPRYFSYNVSSNATAVLFTLTNLDGDVNLVASQGAPLPTLTSFDYASLNPGLLPEDILVFTNSTPVALKPGTWYLGVYNATARPVNYTILATEFTNAFPNIVTLTNAVPYNGANSGLAASLNDYYRYVVSPAGVRVQFETFGADGDVTLVARKGLPLPNLSSYDYFSANPGTNDELIVVLTNSTPVALTPGDWFITAVNTSGGPVNYTIMATEWPQTGRPITIVSQTTDSNSVCITWTSLPGVHYVVQGKVGLTDPNWVDVSPTLTAVDYTTTYCVPLPSPFSFFRVKEGLALGAAVTPTIALQHGLPVTLSLPPGQTLHYSVDVPDWAQAATNVLATLGGRVNLWFNQTGLPTGTNAGDIALISGATNGTSVLNGASIPPLVSAQTYFLTVENTNTTPIAVTLGVEFDIVTLTNAVPFTSAMPTNWSSRPFQFDVSPNGAAVVFDLYGLDGNLDLVVRKGLPLPALTNADYASLRAGTNSEDIIVFTNSQPVALSAGRWYLSVRNPGAQVVNYNVRATEYTLLPPFIELTNSIAYTNSNAGTNILAADFYHYVVTSNATRVQFETYGANADITLLARRGLPPPFLGFYDYRSINPGTNDELIVILTNSVPVSLLPGDWFVTVVNTSGGPADYVIKATDWPDTGRPISIVSAGGSGGQYCISWTSLPGVHYFVEGKVSLTDTAWLNLSGPITATNTVTTWCIAQPTPFQYYRVAEGIVINTNLPPPVISRIAAVPPGFVLTWFGPIDASYEVQWTPTLAPAAWNLFPGTVTTTNGQFNFLDDGSQSGGLTSPRFYRLLQLP
jgi:hypothetical protein